MNTKEKKQIIKPYEQSHIDAHAAKCGGLRNLREAVIHSEDNEEFHYLIKKPSRAVMQAIASAEQKKDIEATQKLMLGCVLEGDKEAYEHDGAIYTQLLKSVGELVHGGKLELKKL